MEHSGFVYVTYYLLFALHLALVTASPYHVEITDNGPIVKGGNITFIATLYYEGELVKGDYTFQWTDNGVPTHLKDVTSNKSGDTWEVYYNSSQYPPGPYVAQVKVCQYILNVFCYTIASARDEFYINDTLNGDLNLIQKNKTRDSIYVSNAEPVIHDVSLKTTDIQVLKNATSIYTYWFVDCVYYDFRNDFQFPFNYTKAETEHNVDALVIADFTPPPPPPTPPPTTTTTSTTTTSTTTTPPPTKKVRRRRGTTSSTEQKIWVQRNNTLELYNGSFPFVCNGPQVAADPHKIYGYFSKKIKVRAPVTSVNVTGNNWLQHGDLLTLNVKCHSSKDIKYCVNFMAGTYNVTGNETCSKYIELDTCTFTINRYFSIADQHTIVIIIENEVSKVVTPVGVTVYKVKKLAQLSVIVVPVAFSLVAVVLIIVGVAHNIQNRSRFVVEVADFDFGQNYSDLEYKTFKERLRDSIVNAFFTRAPSPGSSEVPVWPPGRQYGSMRS